MREIALHILDIAANSISAGAANITISIVGNHRDDSLEITITDDGKGMSPEMVAIVTDPFTTSRTERNVGLGIPLLKAAAEACHGSFRIDSEPGQGTKVQVNFQLGHIDRMPLGDLPNTFLGLLIGTPDVHWIFRVKNDEKEFTFDDAELKKELGEDCLTEPDIIRYIRELFTEEIEVLALN
ncbi:MAG: ATP-binding protein [Anaerolineaceae bacterium]